MSGILPREMPEIPLPYPPVRRDDRRIAVVFLHGGCAMGCLFCVSDTALEGMTQALFARTLDLLEERGFEEVVIGGGEPTEWPHDWRTAARAAKARGFLVQLGTNGRLLPPGYTGFEAVDRFVLPLDGATAETHDQLRPSGGRAGESHHRLILRRLEELRAAGREVTVSTVVNALNVREIGGIAARLNHHVDSGGRLHAWHLYRFLPVGRGGARHADELALSDAAYGAAVALARAAAPDLTLYKRPDMRHSRTVDFFWNCGGAVVTGSEVWGDASKTRAEEA